MFSFEGWQMASGVALSPSRLLEMDGLRLLGRNDVGKCVGIHLILLYQER